MTSDNTPKNGESTFVETDVHTNKEHEDSSSAASLPKKRSTRVKAKPQLPSATRHEVASSSELIKTESVKPEPVKKVATHKQEKKVAVADPVSVQKQEEKKEIIADQKPIEVEKQVPIAKDAESVHQQAVSVDTKKDVEHRPQHAQQHNRNYDHQPRHHQQQRQHNNGGQQRHHQQQRSQHNNQQRQQHTHQQQQRTPQQAQSQQQQQSLEVPQNLPLEKMSLVDLIARARSYGIIGAALLKKEVLIERIKSAQENPDKEMPVKGVLEKLPDGFGFLRSLDYDYVSGPDDVYVSPSQIRRFNLRTGDTVMGVIRKPREGEKYFALLKVDKVNDADPATIADRPQFDQLSPMHPHQKFNLEFNPAAIATRIMDIFTPVGKGQRGLIVAPPKVGKTLLLKEFAQSIIANHPDVHLIILLIDERPEEVADLKRMVRGTSAHVISSTFDESAERHVIVAERVLENAKRLVESGKDVMILLDSITRLARAYNTIAPSSGKVLTGGIDANALQHPKRFFGAARATEEGGSLTIMATAMVDTGSRMEEVIFEEFKGTGNMEIHMNRKLAHRRIYPAFDIPMSGTRRDDLLLSEDDLKKVWVLQKFLGTMNTAEGMEFMIDKMKKYKTNLEFIDSINKKQVA